MKEKFYFKLNLFDGIVLLLVLCMGALMAFFLLTPETQPTQPPVVTQPMPSELEDPDKEYSDKEKKDNPTVHYTIQLQNMLEGVAQCIRPGDTLIHNTKHCSIGKVVSIEIMPAAELVYHEEEHRYVMAEVPGYEDAKIVVESGRLVDWEDAMVLESGYTIQVGKNIYIRCNGLMAAGVVVGMDRLEWTAPEEHEEEDAFSEYESDDQGEQEGKA